MRSHTPSHLVLVMHAGGARTHAPKKQSRLSRACSSENVEHRWMQSCATAANMMRRYTLLLQRQIHFSVLILFFLTHLHRSVLDIFIIYLRPSGVVGWIEARLPFDHCQDFCHTDIVHYSPKRMQMACINIIGLLWHLYCDANSRTAHTKQLDPNSDPVIHLGSNDQPSFIGWLLPFCVNPRMSCGFRSQ